MGFAGLWGKLGPLGNALRPHGAELGCEIAKHVAVGLAAGPALRAEVCEHLIASIVGVRSISLNRKGK